MRERRAALPAGALSFLVTDSGWAARLLQEHGPSMPTVSRTTDA